MGSPSKLFAAIVCCFAFTVVHIYGELVILAVPHDDGNINFNAQSASYTCMSEDDGSALAWSYDGFTLHTEDFKPGRPAPGNVPDCAIRGSSVCLAKWNETSDWRVVNSGAKPTGPVFDQRWEDFQEFRGSGARRYRKIEGLAKKSSSTVWFSAMNIYFGRFGVLLCESEEPSQSPCVWIHARYAFFKGRITTAFCAPGAATRDYSVDDSKCIFQSQRTLTGWEYHGTAEMFHWHTFRLDWDTQRKTIKLFQGNNSASIVEAPIPPWNQVASVATTATTTNKWLSLKVHLFDYFFTDTKNALISTKGIEHSGKTFCAELLLGLCPECKLNVTLVDEDGNDIESWSFSGDGQDPYNGLLAWRLVRLNKDFDSDTRRNLTLKIETILDEDEGAGEWAIDNFRICQSGKLRESRLTMLNRSDKAKCHKISYAGNLKLDAPGFSYVNEIQDFPELRELLRNRNERLDGRLGHMCNESGCICDRRLESLYQSGTLCGPECDDGLYGYKCTEKCGSCRNFEPCVKSIGVCEGGCLQDNMIKPFCKTALVAPTVEDVRGTTVRVLQSIEFDEYVMPDKIEIQIQEAGGETWSNYTAEWKGIFGISYIYEANITGLKPNTDYVVRAVVSMERREELAPTIGPQHNFTTNFDGISNSMVSNLRLSEDKGRIVWDKPADCNNVTSGPKEVARLFVTSVSDSALIKEVQTGDFHYNLSDLALEPLTWYKVRVHLVRGYDEPEHPNVYQELTWRTNLDDVVVPTVVDVTDSTARIIQNVAYSGYDGKVFVTFILREVWSNESFALFPTNTTGVDHELDLKNLKPNALYKIHTLITLLESDRTVTLDGSPILFKTKCLDEPHFEVSPGERIITIDMLTRPEDCKHQANDLYSIAIYDTAKDSFISSSSIPRFPVTILALNPDTEYDVRIWIQRPKEPHAVFTTKVRTSASNEAVPETG